MSLYEASVKSESWSLASVTRPLTTLEGWKEIGHGIYTMKSYIRTFPTRGLSKKGRSDNQSDHRKECPEDPAKPATPYEGQWRQTASHNRSSNMSGDTAVGTMSTELKMEQESQTSQQEHGEPPTKIENSKIQPPAHTFTKRTRSLLVVLVAVAAMIPSLTADMYLPATPSISKKLNISPKAMSATITSYLLMQGISTLLWIPLSNSTGRRRTYIYSLSIYILASIALVGWPNLATLIILRGVQGIGTASVVPLGYATIGDIALTTERASLLHIFQWFQITAMIISPFLGGLLSNFLGFRAVLLFPLIVAAVVLLVSGICLPETLQRVREESSTYPSESERPFDGKWKAASIKGDKSSTRVVVFKCSSIRERLRVRIEKGTVISLVFAGVVFSAWTMVTVSTPEIFTKKFALNDFLLGMALIPSSLGAIVGATLGQNVLERDFMFASAKFKAEHVLEPCAIIDTRHLPTGFPLEHTRLRLLLWTTPVLIAVTCGYGFTLVYPSVTQRPGWIVFPLFLQFLIAVMASAIYKAQQTLVWDLWRQSQFAAYAVTGLSGSLFAAVGVGIMPTLIGIMGIWSFFVGLSIFIMVSVPLPGAQWYFGASWRAQRERKTTSK